MASERPNVPVKLSLPLVCALRQAHTRAESGC